MKNLVCFFVSLFISTIDVSAQKKTVQKTIRAPFQGVKEFCSFLKPVKYTVEITGFKVNITYLYKDYKKMIKGEFRNGKLYTNDKNETKVFAGRLYKVTSNYLSVNNLEGGDYVEYHLCD